MTLIACQLATLDPVEKARYAALRRTLADEVQAVREEPDGYAFRFAYAPSLLATIAAWLPFERQCCPFLAFELQLPPDDAIELMLRGDEEVKVFVCAEFSDWGTGSQAEGDQST